MPGPSKSRAVRPRGARSLLAGAVVLAALAVAPHALAHSGVQATSPKPGAVVQALPATITLTFGSRLMRVSSVRVTDAKGVNHATSARLDPRNAARVVVRTRSPVPGAYRVAWTVQSEDGHSESGAFAFRARGR